MRIKMSQRILVVEDNPDNMKLVGWILEDEGIEFCPAESGEEALLLLDQEAFSMVLLDISLPGIDGKEAARKIRGMELRADTPIVACTAHAIKQEEDAIWAAGVNDIVTKPIDESRLLAIIEKHTKSAG
jgi:CheY-like chemotaxis protein